MPPAGVQTRDALHNRHRLIHMTRIINFDKAKAPHEFAAKERKLKDLRERFVAVHEEARPRKVKSTRKSSKRNKRKKR